MNKTLIITLSASVVLSGLYPSIALGKEEITPNETINSISDEVLISSVKGLSDIKKIKPTIKDGTKYHSIQLNNMKIYSEFKADGSIGKIEFIDIKNSIYIYVTYEKNDKDEIVLDVIDKSGKEFLSREEMVQETVSVMKSVSNENDFYLNEIAESFFKLAEEGYKRYYDLLMSGILGVLMPSLPSNMHGDLTDDLSGMLASYSVDYWRIEVANDILSTGDYISSNIESGTISAFGGDNIFSTALSVYGVGLTGAIDLINEVTKNAEMAKSEYDFYMKEREKELVKKEEELQRKRDAVAHLTPDYRKADMSLSFAKKYRTLYYMKTSLKDIENVINPVYKEKLMLDWDLNLKEEYILLLEKDNADYKIAVIKLRNAKKYGMFYIEDARKAIEKVKNDTLRLELMNELNSI